LSTVPILTPVTTITNVLDAAPIPAAGCYDQ